MIADNLRTDLLKQLSAAGIRPSAQRIAILEYISACRCHPTADDVYSSLVEQNPTLSRTTVFSCKQHRYLCRIHPIRLGANGTSRPLHVP